jgi:hypothetical protein
MIWIRECTRVYSRAAAGDDEESLLAKRSSSSNCPSSTLLSACLSQSIPYYPCSPKSKPQLGKSGKLATKKTPLHPHTSPQPQKKNQKKKPPSSSMLLDSTQHPRLQLLLFLGTTSNNNMLRTLIT